MRYIDLIRAIKAAPNGFFMNITTPNMEMLRKLNQADCIEMSVKWADDIGDYVYYVREKHRNQANPTPSAPQQHVQVQWWQHGARQGEYSQQAYEVVEADAQWTTIRLMGKRHVIATARTRGAAA